MTLLTQMKLLSISQDSYEVRPFARGHIRIYFLFLFLEDVY